MTSKPKQWHHSPLHVFVSDSMYFVTASTLHKKQLFTGNDKLCLLQNTIFEVADVYGWHLQAWAIFSNHYHFIAQSPEDAKTLKPMIQRLHSQSSRKLNAIDYAKGRQVWFQYWDTCITFEKSYYARLNYVNNNPVKHGVATLAEKYPFCSAAWFLARADPGFRRKVQSFGYERVNIIDDF